MTTRGKHPSVVFYLLLLNVVLLLPVEKLIQCTQHCIVVHPIPNYIHTSNTSNVLLACGACDWM